MRACAKNGHFFFLIHVIIINRLFYPQVIEAYMWSIQMENKRFFAADTTVFQIVAMRGSTRRLWKGENFQQVNVMVVPMNITTRHWTLLVCSVHFTSKYPLLLFEQFLTSIHRPLM